jgi:hypothetical protein
VRAKKKHEIRGSTGMTDHASEDHANEPEHLSPNASKAPNDTIELDFSFPDIPISPAAGPGSITLGSFNDTVLSWPTELIEQGQNLDNDYVFEDGPMSDIFGQLSPNELELPEQRQQRHRHPRQQMSPISDYHLSSLDFDLSENRPPSSLSRGRHSQPQTPFPMDRQSRHHTEKGTNSQCVIVCSQMIVSLEKYLIDELKVLDLILGIVKNAIGRLAPLVNGQIGPRNSKCLALFSTILYQVIELLEAGCANFLAEGVDDRLPNSPSDLLSGSLHDLGFGAFSTTSGDQRRFHSQIVLEELRPLTEIMRKVIMLSNAGFNGCDPRGGTGQVRIRSHRDLEDRLKLLIEKLRRAGGL